MVLVALTEKLFERLCWAIPHDLIFKFLFLLAAALARNACEIYALCTDSPFIIQNPWSFCLALKPAFLPKTSTEVALSSDLKITAFCLEPTRPLRQGLQLMCPVSTLHMYFQMYGAYPWSQQVSVHWDEGRTRRPASK